MRYRATKPADLRIARDFLPAGYRYSPELRDALPQIWERLLRSGQLNSMVLEGPDQCVLGMGLSMFVADYFAERELAAPRPYLNARLHEMIRAGHSPVLDQRAIAKGNSEPGLTLMPLHFCTASFDTSDPEIIRILLAAQDTFRITHAGFRVKRMLKEVVGINLCRYMVSCGMNLHCDHASDAKIRGLAEDEHPYLLAVNHAEMPLGSTLSTMFAPTSRRFHFSPAEQKLLRSAILLEADEDIAAELNLSRDTLRKQWRSIYERVRHVDPLFFPEDAVLAQDDGVRGRGKRRHLLQYLQLYMEELRPYQKSEVASSRMRGLHRGQAPLLGVQAYSAPSKI